MTWILGRSGLSADAGECTRIWHMLLYRTCDGCSWRRELFNPFWVLWLDSCFDGPEDSEECVGATDGGPTFCETSVFNVWWMPSRCTITWVSLSSPSSMEDKRCGFDLVISRQCMQRLGATIRWAPTNRQLADALTKDAADPVDLLRSCIALCGISTVSRILERAAAERSRRKQRQTSSQSSSLQSEPSVSSNAFMVQQGSV